MELELMKTIKSYLKLLRKVEMISASSLKCYDKLSDEQKEILRYLNAEISNHLGEFKDA